MKKDLVPQQKCVPCGQTHACECHAGNGAQALF